MSGDSDSAFPWMETADTNRGEIGLTKREYELIQYRAAALTGLMSHPDNMAGINLEAKERDMSELQALALAAEGIAAAMYRAAHPEEGK